MKKTYVIAGILATATIATLLSFAMDQGLSESSLYSIPSVETADADKPQTHTIELAAVQLDYGQVDPMNGDIPVFGYKMVKHEVMSQGGKVPTVLTDNYEDHATIPGPTIVVDEGDTVNLTLYNHIGSGCVSLHVHGIHYGIDSDGTLSMINGNKDQCAKPDQPFEYTWTAGKGTVGTWPYHDHTLGTGDGGHMHGMSGKASSDSDIVFTEEDEHEFGMSMHGSSSKGLFGTLIVNPKSSSVEAFVGDHVQDIPLDKVSKEIVLYMIGTRFYGMEIDNAKGEQLALWENPELVAKLNDYVRVHVLVLGSDSGSFHKMASGMPMEHLPEEFHTFHLHGHRWIEQGTETVLDTKTRGPAESTQFVIKAGDSVGTGKWMYHCHVQHHMEMGMWGIFNVTPNGGPSMPDEETIIPEMMHGGHHA